MTGTHKRYSTKTPGAIQVQHEAELVRSFGLVAPSSFPCAPFLCWDGYDERAFVRVTENDLVTNYPCMCLPSVFFDCIKTKNWQSHGTEYTHAKSCTPMHTCCFLELCGEVAVSSVHPVCNQPLGWCCFPGLSTFVVGLKDAESFCAAANSARDAHIAKLKSTSAPEAQRM